MKTITINGKGYPCRVTMGAMLRYKRATGQDVSRMDSDDTAALVTFLWCCVSSACNADGVEFPYTLDDFADRLDPEGVTAFYQDMEAAAGKDNGNEKKTGDRTS